MIEEFRSNRVEDVDDSYYWEMIESRFGFDRADFQEMKLGRSNKVLLVIYAEETNHPLNPKMLAVGMPFLHIGMKTPKPTTSAVIAYGHLAKQNTIELTQDQVDLYYGRLDIHFDAMPPGCNPGFVIVRYMGHGLGTALLKETETGSFRLMSHFPKADKIDASKTSCFAVGP